MLRTLVKLLGKNDGHLSTIPKEKIQLCTTICQIKDCKELLRCSEELIFGQDGKKEYSAVEFKKIFLNEDKQNSLSYLLLADGYCFNCVPETFDCDDCFTAP